MDWGTVGLKMRSILKNYHHGSGPWRELMDETAQKEQTGMQDASAKCPPPGTALHF